MSEDRAALWAPGDGAKIGGIAAPFAYVKFASLRLLEVARSLLDAQMQRTRGPRRLSRRLRLLLFTSRPTRLAPRQRGLIVIATLAALAFWMLIFALGNFLARG
jgi:hypothetical protein